jgi:hypothetical protein
MQRRVYERLAGARDRFYSAYFRGPSPVAMLMFRWNFTCEHRYIHRSPSIYRASIRLCDFFSRFCGLLRISFLRCLFPVSFQTETFARASKVRSRGRYPASKEQHQAYCDTSIRTPSLRSSCSEKERPRTDQPGPFVTNQQSCRQKPVLCHGVVMLINV